MAVRERVAVFDQTSFAKALVVGRDADKALSWIAANDVAKPPGHVVYTQMLNARGGIECDLTVSRLAESEYYIAPAPLCHPTSLIARSILAGLDARFCVTSAWWLPSWDRSRECRGSDQRRPLQRRLPIQGIRRIALDAVLALRITYVGELGWELHIPVEFAAGVWDAVMEACEPYGIASAGYRAIESLRLEKGYRSWGTDIGPDHSPLMAGLGWAVKLRTDIPFQGRAALEAQAGGRLPRLLAGFTTDPAVVLLGRETIYRDGKRVGWLTSGGYGYTVGRSIGFGYVRDAENGVDRDMVLSGRYELEVARERVPAEVFLKPLNDPTITRIKA